MTQETNRLITAQEAAAVLHVTRFRLYELARIGLLPTVRLGRQVRFDPSALQAFIETGGKGLEAT
jgi:excisionase family DNA binding protein